MLVVFALGWVFPDFDLWWYAFGLGLLYLSCLFVGFGVVCVGVGLFV